MPPVSVIIPARNAEAVLPDALDSVLRQDYGGPIEVIVADGSDTPTMGEMLQQRYPAVRVTHNPEHIVSTGFNRALREARGDIVVRCDAHSTLPPGYVRRAVETLTRTGAATVGGRQIPVGTTMFRRAVAMAMSNFLGAGNARYRLGGAEGPTDTVYLGAWRRETLVDARGFDIASRVNEDYELNWRLRKQGKVVWFDPELKSAYLPRGSLAALAAQYFNYGRWKSAGLILHPLSLRARHLAAPALTLGLAASAALAVSGALWALTLPIAYLLTLVVGAMAIGVSRRDSAAVLVPLALATIHIAWGTGFFFPPRRRPPRRS